MSINWFSFGRRQNWCKSPNFSSKPQENMTQVMGRAGIQINLFPLFWYHFYIQNSFVAQKRKHHFDRCVVRSCWFLKTLSAQFSSFRHTSKWSTVCFLAESAPHPQLFIHVANIERCARCMLGLGDVIHNRWLLENLQRISVYCFCILFDAHIIIVLSSSSYSLRFVAMGQHHSCSYVRK